MDWQLIETAPKDGTWVLLWCDFAIVGRWSVKGNRVRNNWTDDYHGVNPVFSVTHWMPLPAPPLQRMEGNGE